MESSPQVLYIHLIPESDTEIRESVKLTIPSTASL